ncbi:MAG: type II toxin-antitoxin system PemK/MazF family toxin [Dehalococcoidia bacterium]|nr:type II toxin-antitoxin system PemK/MazF family toxin [Dehalococcoidia bacterium]
MKRGEIWTVAGGGDFTGKPRPVAVIQDDRFAATDSVTVCVFTSEPVDAPLFRVSVESDGGTGLQALSWLMADKITTVRKERLGVRLGQLRGGDIRRLNSAILLFLGLAAAFEDPEDVGA